VFEISFFYVVVNRWRVFQNRKSRIFLHKELEMRR
jgi:hypothetical protein